jgi:hypothetical protein
MSSLEDISEELPDVIVTLNISQVNLTMNGTQAKTFMKSNFCISFF